MVKLPDSTALGTRLPSAQGMVPNFGDVGAVGRAVQGLGQSVQRAGLSMAEMAKAQQDEALQRAKFGAQSRLLEFEQNWRESYRERSQNVQPGAVGFEERLRDDYRQSARRFLQSVPDEFKGEVDQKLFRLESDLSETAAGLETKEMRRYAIANIDEGTNRLINRQTEDPASWSAVEQDGIDLIRNAPGLTPIEKDEAIRKWQADRARKDIEARVALGDYGGLQADLGVTSSYMAKVEQVESGGRVAAKAKTSSATGLHQFTEGTWLDVAKRYEPGLAAVMSDAELLALRTDPDVSRRMFAHLTDANRKALQRADLPVTDGSLYLAHFAGSGGAVALLRADPSASVESILGQKAINANKFLAGKTAAGVIAWADKKMGSVSATAVAPRYANLPADVRIDALEGVRRGMAQAEADEQKRQLALATQRREALDLGIVTGDVVDRDTILGDDLLDDGDKATLLRRFDEHMKDRLSAGAALSGMLDGTWNGNPFDKDHRKAIDGVYQATGVAGSLLAGDDETTNQLVGLTRRAGMVPPAAVTEIRGGLSSEHPGRVEAALQVAARVEGAGSGSLNAIDGGKDVRDAAVWFRHWTGERGLTPADAARRYMAIERAGPEREQRLKTAAQLSKDLSESDIVSEFDDGSVFNPVNWFSGPDLGGTEGLRAAAMADYRSFFEERFAETGDKASAKALAIDDMKRIYGVSTLLGRDVVMRYPPETIYPAVNGGHDYVRDQLVASISEHAGQEVDPDDIVLFALPETGGAMSNGQLAPVGVMYFEEREDGQKVLQTIPGFGFVPDVGQARAAYDEARKGRERGAQRIDDFMRDVAPSLTDMSAAGRPIVTLPEITVRPDAAR